MDIIKYDFYSGPNIGIYSKVNDEFVVLTQNDGLFKINNNIVSKWSTDLDNLDDLNIFSSQISSDNNILIGTVGSGLIKYNLISDKLEK